MCVPWCRLATHKMEANTRLMAIGCWPMRCYVVHTEQSVLSTLGVCIGADAALASAATLDLSLRVRHRGRVLGRVVKDFLRGRVLESKVTTLPTTVAVNTKLTLLSWTTVT